MSFLPAAGSLIGGILGISSGLMGSSTAKQGSQEMAQGNLLAMLMQKQMFDQVQGQLQPFREFGSNALQTLAPLIGLGGDPLSSPLTAKFAPTIERLMQTPGYQFTLDQGLRNVQNAFAAKGLGSSSNALRGAAEYATGLASQTFNDQFRNYWTENQNIFNMLSGAGQTGLSAAGMGAQAAPQFANMMGSAAQGYGNALGQGTIGANNALWRGIGDAYGVLNASPTLGGNMNSWWNQSPSMNFFGFGQPGTMAPF